MTILVLITGATAITGLWGTLQFFFIGDFIGGIKPINNQQSRVLAQH